MENWDECLCDSFHENRMHVCYLLSSFRGVAQSWRDEILLLEGMLPSCNPAYRRGWPHDWSNRAIVKQSIENNIIH